MYAAEVLKNPVIKFDHAVFDRNCSAYMKAQKVVQSKTVYGDGK